MYLNIMLTFLSLSYKLFSFKKFPYHYSLFISSLLRPSSKMPPRLHYSKNKYKDFLPYDIKIPQLLYPYQYGYFSEHLFSSSFSLYSSFQV